MGWVQSAKVSLVQFGAAGCEKGFVTSFLMFHLLAWAAWQLQFSPTACGTLIKHVAQPFPQPAAPDCTVHPACKVRGAVTVIIRYRDKSLTLTVLTCNY